MRRREKAGEEASRLNSIVDAKADRRCRYKGPDLSHTDDQGL